LFFGEKAGISDGFVINEYRKNKIPEPRTAEAGGRRGGMELRLTPKAQKVIAEHGNSVTVRLEEKICYS
jgi:hypothetical protein